MAIRWYLKDKNKSNVYYDSEQSYRRDLNTYEWDRPKQTPNYYCGFKTKKAVLKRIEQLGLPNGVTDYELVKTGDAKDTPAEDGKVIDSICIPIHRGDLILDLGVYKFDEIGNYVYEVEDILYTPGGKAKIITAKGSYLLKDYPMIVVTEETINSFKSIVRKKNSDGGKMVFEG